MKRCSCEHWQICPTCYPQGFDEHGVRKPVEVPPSREELQRQVVALREQVERLTKERDELVNAIDNEMVMAHIGVFNSGDDPKVAMNKLQCYAEDLGSFFAQDQLNLQAAEIARLKAQLKSMERVELEEPNWSNNNEV